MRKHPVEEARERLAAERPAPPEVAPIEEARPEPPASAWRSDGTPGGFTRVISAIGHPLDSDPTPSCGVDAQTVVQKFGEGDDTYFIQNHPGRDETARTLDWNAVDGFTYPIRLEDGRQGFITDRQLAERRRK